MNVTATPRKLRDSHMFIRCPHCESKANVRTSQQESKLVRSMICQCTNVFCGHTFVAHLEAVRTIAPSAIPDANVRLPRSDSAALRGRLGILAGYKKPAKRMPRRVTQ